MNATLNIKLFFFITVGDSNFEPCPRFTNLTHEKDISVGKSVRISF